MIGARKFFESDEKYEEYLIAEKVAALVWIDILGRKGYTKAADKLEAELKEVGIDFDRF